ncbi:hypothetical protein A8708_00640 [Paenibacillus oryzisoli]|uniref:Uncharacterized protein n=1 Tax=Paenibacillus oryzisoli TaxID=1850517 RepID=A0A198AEE2_9BACL|nr:hypothetical protein A8708_00640 [Paenibacillus oryzisoli]
MGKPSTRDPGIHDEDQGKSDDKQMKLYFGNETNGRIALGQEARPEDSPPIGPTTHSHSDGEVEISSNKKRVEDEHKWITD